MKLAICILVLAALIATCSFADTWHPKITPVDQVQFNWPPPKEIGQPDYFTIARDGVARCSIVIPANPSPQEEKSAGMLATYLGIVTGGTFEVKREPASGPAIYIGNTTVGLKFPMDFPPIKYPSLTLPNLHAFMIETVDPNTLVMRSATAYAVTYAVSSFLRQIVGVERYWPTEPGGFGDVYTLRPTLTIPQLTWKDWPYLISRHVGFPTKGWDLTHENDYPNMFFWYRCATTLGMMHNFFELLPQETYGAAHPEYYPEINGVRQVPKAGVQINWQPCVSNPEVVDICAQEIISAFDKDPLRICHALAVNDGAGDCMCAKCRAMDSLDADANTRVLTDRYVKFMNAVAEKVAAKYPDRLLGFLSYSSLTYPPTTTTLHPSLVPYYCAMGRGVYIGWDQWMAAGAKNMGHYGYHDDRWFTIPKINPHQEAERIRYMVGSGIQRGYYKEFNPTYPLDAQAATVCADMQWDPRLDEDAILAKYYDDMFAESSKEMRGFYETLEADYEKWLRETAPPHPYGYDRTDLDLDHSYEQFQVLTAKGAKTALDHLIKAKSMATDAKVVQRIDLVEALYRFVYLCDNEYWLIQSLPTCRSVAQAEKQARQVLWYARTKADYKRDVMETPEVKPWHMTTREPYDQIKVGVIPEEVYQAIDRGFRSAYRTKDRAEWERLARDADPAIAKSAQAVLAMNADQPNLVEDGGFEQGIKPEVANDDPKEGKAVITSEHPHSGQKCAMIYDCKASSLVKRIAVKPGEKVWVSAWVRAMDYPGRFNIIGLYGLRVNAKQGTKVVNWVREKIEPALDWQQYTMPYTVPAGVDTLEVTVNVMRQHAKARAWVDDISVVRAPIEPMDLSVAGPTASPEGPPE